MAVDPQSRQACAFFVAADGVEVLAEDGSPVHRMEQVGHPEVLADIQREAADTVFARLDPVPHVAGLERFAYYAQARGACVVVLTGETMPYGNFLLRKGVL